MTYQPTTRLLTVLELLQARGVVTGAELAARLEVDARSVRRYVVSLQDLGIPIEGVPGPGGGYRLHPGHRMAPLMLTGAEAIALTLGLLALRRSGPDVDPIAAAGALAKVERVLPASLARTVAAIEAATSIDTARSGSRPSAQIVATAARATYERRRMHLRYRASDGRVTDRAVDPYGIAATLGHWYLVGWCHLRRGIRSFRIDRIVELTDALPEPTEAVEPPAGFDVLEHLTRGIATMPSRFVLEIEYPASLADVAARVPPSYAQLEPFEGGTLARYPADDLEVMAAYLASLAMPFRVRGPDALREALASLAQRILVAAGRATA